MASLLRIRSHARERVDPGVPEGTDNSVSAGKGGRPGLRVETRREDREEAGACLGLSCACCPRWRSRRLYVKLSSAHKRHSLLPHVPGSSQRECQGTCHSLPLEEQKDLSSVPGVLLAASEIDRWDSGLWAFPGSMSNLSLQEQRLSTGVSLEDEARTGF